MITVSLGSTSEVTSPMRFASEADAVEWLQASGFEYAWMGADIIIGNCALQTEFWTRSTPGVSRRVVRLEGLLP